MGVESHDVVVTQEQQEHGDPERGDHRDDLTPRIDAPPEPAQQENESSPGADLEQDLERL